MSEEDDEKHLKMMLYVVMGIATIGLIFFIVNFIRCRMSWTHIDEYEEEEENRINKETGGAQNK